MSYQIFFSYFKKGVDFINSKLLGPAEILKSNLSLNTDELPDTLSQPLNFSMLLTFTLFTIMSYANNFMCSIVGILYPMIHSLKLLNDASPNLKKVATILKYWVLFGIITLFDTLFGFFLHIIPGFFYLKFTGIYLLLRNDFALTNYVFTALEKYYYQYDIGKISETLLQYIYSQFNNYNNKINSDKKLVEQDKIINIDDITTTVGSLEDASQ